VTEPTQHSQGSLRQRLFPWASRPKSEEEYAYTVKYRVDSADSMHIIVYENGKRLWDEGYLLWSNLTWAKLWTPHFIRKAIRARKKDERMARLNQRADMDIKYHHSDRFHPHPNLNDW
jgi:hypothetical protein